MKLDDIKARWALVTGASEGIGREFCRQLAASGVHLVLVARREPLLQELAQELTGNHGIQTAVLPTDLSQPDAARDLREKVVAQGITIGLLINNAGSGRWGRFEEASLTQYEAMLMLNTNAMVSLCYQFLPDLSSFPSSAIINVGSPAAFQPVPYMAVYAASKAFVHSFSQALYGEWQARGILVQTLVPGPTATEFDTKANAYESALTTRGSPADVVNTALAHLANDQPLVLAAKGTYQQRLFAGLFPAKMVIQKVGRMFQPPEQ